MPRAQPIVAIDPDTVADLLGPDGPIAAALGRYEDRPSQREMARRVSTLYSRGGIGLIEAGTGVGKSLGYLVPALRWAAANGERTIVSTATITLQEQLVGKDLPFLAEALTDQPVRFALLKGWRNYLCLQRLEQARAAGASLFDSGASAELDALAAWADQTRDGSTADLLVAPRTDVWDEVAAEPDLCTRLRCPHFEQCFVFHARKLAAQADIVVVNHHLLMADVAVRRASGKWAESAVLPAYSRLVIDEGHHLEDAASSHLGQTVTRRGVQRLFARLDRNGKGLLHSLERKLVAADDLLSIASLDLVRARLVPAATTARALGMRLFDILDEWMHARGEQQVRLTPGFDDEPVWRAGLGASLDDVLREIEVLAEGLVMVRERLETDERRAEELAPLRIVVDHDRCHQCGACTAACTSNVRVHEEVRDFGQVVDPGCMKCMDCVSACPNQALRFGLGTPAIAVDRAGRRAAASAARRWDLSWPEEIALAAIGVVTLLLVQSRVRREPVFEWAVIGVGAFLVAGATFSSGGLVALMIAGVGACAGTARCARRSSAASVGTRQFARKIASISVLTCSSV